jgi:hypothetical protein
VDFKQKLLRRDKDDYMLIMRTVHQEDKNTFEIYVSTIGSQIIKETLLNIKCQIGPNTIILADHKNSISSIDPEKINKHILELKNTTGKMDLTAI